MLDDWSGFEGYGSTLLHLALSVCVALVAAYLVLALARSDTRRLLGSANAEVLKQVVSHENLIGRFAGRLEALERNVEYLGVRIGMLETAAFGRGGTPPPAPGARGGSE